MIVCNYCEQQAVLVGGERIYPHRPDLFDKQFYICEPCNAYVGCHPGTINPLGRLANGELRKWKKNAHAMFDPLWKSKKMSRSKAYAWLSKQLNIDGKDCHIGMFDVEQCKNVIRVAQEFYK